jgi:thioredoxin reductase (NADPH)
MHLSRAGYRTLLLEKDEPGGQASRLDWIENYPGFPEGVRGSELMDLWLTQARRWGLNLLKTEARKIERQEDGSFKIILPKGPTLTCRAVLCCAGAKFKRLGVPGEDEFQERGVYNAAFDEAPRFRNKTVAVVGAGETAVHQAILLSKFAERVFLFSRGSEIKAHPLLKKRMASCANLVHVPGMVVERLEGRNILERIRIRDTAKDLSGNLELSGIFVLIGKRQDTALRPKASERAPGYFIAGDASGTLCRQVVVAAGRGMEAAMDCIRYLEGWNDSSSHEDS